MNSFLSKEEVLKIGFKNIGENVLISRHANIYSPSQISIGNNVRIDDFCILSGQILLGDYIHIAAYTALYGGSKGIFVDDYANISSKITIYAKSDDYSGHTMSNPTIPNEFKNIIEKTVRIEKHVILGSGSVVLPGVILREGSSFGAMTMINKDSKPWSINVGIPFKKVKNRSKKLLELERKFKQGSGAQ